MALSQTFHDTNGTTQEWDLSLSGGYLAKDHVKAYFYPTGNLADARSPVTFTWVHATRIRINPALAAGGKLLIQRETPKTDTLVQFTNTADFTRENLLTVARQGIFVAAETTDLYEDPELLGAISDAKDAADTATAKAAEAASYATQAGTSRTESLTYSNNSATSATAAAVSATLASDHAAAANTAAVQSGDARDAATTAKNAATTAKNAAAAYATDSATSASASAASASLAATNAIAQSGVASYKGLSVVSTLNSGITEIYAVEATLRHVSTGAPIFLRNVSCTSYIAVSGTNGIETGTPWLANRWYALWIIYNGTNVSSLLSNSWASPNMPSGYTHGLRVGWVKTDNSLNKWVIPFIQNDDMVQWVNSVSYPLQKLAVGVQGNVTTPTLVVVNVRSTSSNDVGLCPSTAIEVRLHVSWWNATMMVSPNNAYGGQTSTTNQPMVCASHTSHGSIIQDMMLESNNVYIASDSSNNYVAVIGWRDTR